MISIKLSILTANPFLRDTPSAAALILVVLAAAIRTVLFVAAVGTVQIAIASECRRNAFSVRFAREHIRRALIVLVRRAILFVGIVATIVLAVASIQIWNACFVEAREETRRARVLHLRARLVGERLQ